MNQAEFFQQHAVDGVLPPQFMAQLLVSGMPEGDTPTVPTVGTDEPPVVEAATTPAAPAAPAAASTPTPAPAPEPVVLAKDGVHTIPFAQLEAARQQASELAAQNAQLQAQLAAAATPAATPTASPAPAAPALDVAKLTEGVDFGDYSDAAMAKATALIATRAAHAAAEQATQAAIDRFAASQPKAVDPAVQAAITAIYTAHPNLDSMVESQEFATWRSAQPTWAQPGIEAVLAQGTAPEVIDLFNAYKAATGTTPPASTPAAPAVATPSATAEAEAAAAIAAAKAKAPTSLSEVPAGTQAHVDQNAALLQATPQQLMARMATMSPAEIEALVSRAL